MYDVIVLEMDNKSYEDDDVVIAWAEQYGVKYPSVSGGEGGAATVWRDYSSVLQGTPSVAIIKPDKSYSYYIGASSINRNLYGAVENTSAEKHACEDLEVPEVSVTSPGGSDVLVVSTEHDITWTASDNVGVTGRAIYFSSDNGSNWTSIDSSDSNSGTYTWTVPDEVSSECKIEIFAYDAAGNVGNSESEVFEIGPETHIIYHSEKAGNLIKFKRTSESFLVYIPFSGNHAVTISDVQGRTLYSFTTSGNRNWYTISNSLPSGMHILSIKTSENTFVEKFWFVR